MEKIIISTERQVMLDGLLTLGLLENGLRIADFQCCEDVLLDAFSGTFKVEGKRDGNVYLRCRKDRISAGTSISRSTRISWSCCPRNWCVRQVR